MRAEGRFAYTACAMDILRRLYDIIGQELGLYIIAVTLAVVWWFVSRLTRAVRWLRDAPEPEEDLPEQERPRRRLPLT